MPNTKIVEDYQALAERIGWTWLGTFPKNTRSDTNWLCPRRHERSASYSNLANGMGCRVCQSAKSRII